MDRRFRPGVRVYIVSNNVYANSKRYEPGTRGTVLSVEARPYDALVLVRFDVEEPNIVNLMKVHIEPLSVLDVLCENVV
jgi:hypothetical protein